MTELNHAKRPVYVVDGCRSSFLKAKNKPGPFTASDLAVGAGKALLNRQNFDFGNIDEVILGSVMPGADETNIARVCALRLGLPQHIPAWTVQRNCASGMQALDSAANNIANGLSDLVLAGGVDAMSYAPLILNLPMTEWFGAWSTQKTFLGKLKLLTKLRLSYFVPVISLIRGLTDHVVGLSMGQTAEILAHRFHIEREQMDEFAVQSHARLGQAQDEG
ncbi:MAG: beta-ketoacyl synthase N-terminal-like domain-containing protein, partial [Chlamydiota bacterium]|nr:beta-ketoacyl synthase N-terminal-like domain-containing protein [Chlamydiota bacterium]